MMRMSYLLTMQECAEYVKEINAIEVTCANKQTKTAVK